MDSHADWFLAKSIFNVIDVDINAIVHFVLHFVIVNIAIAAEKNLADEHPLFRPIHQAGTLNSGIIGAGVTFWPMRFDWEDSFLKTDLENRGVSDIPGFLYRNDAGALSSSLKKYVQSYLSPFYKGQASVAADEELHGFLNDLSSDPSALSFIPGFPSASDVTSIRDVMTILTQILWITGVDHHALNSYRIIGCDFVYPKHPQKILSPSPATKGQLTDDDVLQQYIAKPFPLTPSRRRLSPTDRTGRNSYIPWEHISQAQQNLTTTPSADDASIEAATLLSPIATFIAAQLFGFVFWPLLEQTDRITNIYFSDTSFKNSAAASPLRADLIKLSQAIKKREAATEDAPEYLLLDPERLPFYLYI